MITKRTYKVPFSIDGEIILEAASAEEAQRIVDEDWGKLVLADEGELETWLGVPVTAHETETIQ
jgi:hypothetical protein